MKVVNYARYIQDSQRVTELRPRHREYMSQLGAEGKLVAGGPFIDGSGALFIYEVDSLDAATSIVAADPYMTGGALATYELRPWEIIGADRDHSHP